MGRLAFSKGAISPLPAWAYVLASQLTRRAHGCPFFGVVFPALVIGDESSGFLQGRLQSVTGVSASLRAS